MVLLFYEELDEFQKMILYQANNIQNGFLLALMERHKFRLGEKDYLTRNDVAFYIAPENKSPINANKKPLFQTELEVSGPSNGWYKISFDANNINKPFVFNGPGNTIRITFKHNQ